VEEMSEEEMKSFSILADFLRPVNHKPTIVETQNKACSSNGYDASHVIRYEKSGNVEHTDSGHKVFLL
jgi:hypothetical protein